MTVRYWIDEMGVLWKGPVAPDSTMHYATLDGGNRYVGAIWTIRRSAEPEDVEEITAQQTEKIVTRYVNEGSLV